jgi:hypothetical protein
MIMINDKNTHVLVSNLLYEGQQRQRCKRGAATAT